MKLDPRTQRATLFLLSLITLISLAESAWAHPRRSRQHRYAGDGCPAGSVSLSESPDNSSVTLLFDRFQVEAGGTTGRRGHRLYCDFTIPIEVPADQKLGVVQVDYRGFNGLSPRARGQLVIDYLFGSSRAPSFFYPLSPQAIGEFKVTDRIGARALRWSECGTTVEIKGRALLSVTTNPNSEQSLASLDTLDATRGGLTYGLQFRPCTEESRPERPNGRPPRNGPQWPR